MMPAEPRCVIRDLPYEPELNRDEPGHRKDRQRLAPHRDGTGNNWDGTVAPPGPIQTPAELRQRPGGAPLRYISKPALCRDATGIHRGSARALPATTGVKPGLPAVLRYTGALPGRCRFSPGLNRGTTGDNRGSAGFHWGSSGTLPATTGALPGLHRDKPQPVRVDRDSVGLLTGFNQGGTGK
ncbi:hypothetical protein DPMN_040795 [Dreissena polymorpha]|uniref:Uncharacterized protein n=1 Tax=Dreissena polymorpha TaxID=45954 RepID=A0A9D4CVP3_DREPO|nr:hypothetical protein DPMN_040795 [Dreissena polymorpha]